MRVQLFFLVSFSAVVNFVIASNSTVRIGSASISYECFGTGHSVVLLSGLGTTLGKWHNLAESQLPGFRVCSALPEEATSSKLILRQAMIDQGLGRATVIYRKSKVGHVPI